MLLDALCQRSAVPAEEEQQLRQQLNWHLFLRVVLLSLLLGISILLQSKGHEQLLPRFRYVVYFIVGVYLFTIASALFLKTIGQRCQQLFAYLQLLTDVLLISCLVLFSGGSQSLFTFVYFFPIITGGLMLFRRGSLYAAALATLCYGAVIAYEYFGFHPILLHRYWASPLVTPQIAMHYFAVPGITFFLVAMLSSLLSTRLLSTEQALSETARNYDRLALLYKQIFDDITSGIITVDPQDRITSFNRAAEEITGFTAEEVLNRPIERNFPEFAPQNRELLRPMATLTRKDSEVIPVGYSWARLNMPDGQENYRVYTFQDLSQIKRMEDQVRQAEKMAAIGEMAAGIAHEFRNPLAAISGAAQVLSRELEEDPVRQGLMRIILRESDRLEKAISEFLQFSKPAVPEKQWFSLVGLVQDTVAVLMQSADWNPDCILRIDIPPNLDCWADTAQLQQIFFNLINNSCIALGPTGGEITISAAEQTEEESERMVITVADTGPGIPAKIAGRIFEPFFTTRDTGTGLGLALVRQIVTAHGGDIRIGSRTGRGAVFIVSLPLP